MDYLTRQSRGLRVVLVGVALAVQQGCGADQSPPNSAQGPALTEEAEISWDSPKMRDIEKEWESLYDRAKVPGELGEDRLIASQRMVERLFRKRLSEQDVHQLVHSCDTLPVHVEKLTFTGDVLAFLVKVSVNTQDRENLIDLLSRRCPSFIDWPQTIEYYLVCKGERLKDPILIFGEAYAKCQVPETRHNLAAAIRRGFVDLGIHGQDDADYVNNAMQWYEREKDHLYANWEYANNEMAAFPVDVYERHPELYDNPRRAVRDPLFVKKTALAETPNRNQESMEGPSQVADSMAGVESTGSVRTVDGELAKLQGTWAVADAVAFGDPVPQETIKGFRFVFHKGTVTWDGWDGKKREARVCLLPEQQPPAFDLRSIPKPAVKNEEIIATFDELREETTPAIYELKGDSLRICLARPGASQRPTSFNAEKGSGETLFALTRVSGMAASTVWAIGIFVAVIVAVTIAMKPWKRLRRN